MKNITSPRPVPSTTCIDFHSPYVRIPWKKSHLPSGTSAEIKPPAPVRSYLPPAWIWITGRPDFLDEKSPASGFLRRSKLHALICFHQSLIGLCQSGYIPPCPLSDQSLIQRHARTHICLRTSLNRIKSNLRSVTIKLKRSSCVTPQQNPVEIADNIQEPPFGDPKIGNIGAMGHHSVPCMLPFSQWFSPRVHFHHST